MADPLAALEESLSQVNRELAGFDALVEQRGRLEEAIAILKGTRPSNNGGSRPRGGRGKPPVRATSPGPGYVVDDAQIVDALEKAQVDITAGRLRELAAIPESVPSHVFTKRMAELVQSGRVVRTGERRGTRYRIA